MLAVGCIGPSSVAPRTSRGGAEARGAVATPATQARALIPIAAPAPSDRSGTASRRPLAAFLAHLIATQIQAPQTRTRRRAVPDEVMAVYGIASARVARTGRKLARDA